MDSLSNIISEQANEMSIAHGSAQQSSDLKRYRTREYFEERAKAFNASRVAARDGIDCSICGNKGLVQYVLELNGRFYEQCQQCACVAQRQARKKIDKSGLKDAIDETGEYECKYDWQRIIKNKADKFITQTEKRCFFIGGQSGAGKTHIATLIAKQLMMQNKSLLYHKWTELIKALNDFNNDQADELYRQVTKVKVLYLDDVLKPSGGTQYTRPEIRTTFEIIDRRYVNKDCITILSSELTSDKINRIDTATYRRIEEMAGEFVIDIGEDAGKIFRRVDWGH